MTESVLTVDMRTRIASLQRKPILTRDNLTVGFETTVYYRVIDPVKVIYKLGAGEREAMSFVLEMAHSAMRSVGGEHTLQEILENRGKISRELSGYVEGQVEPWGLFIENIFIKGTPIPTQICTSTSKPSRTCPRSPNKNDWRRQPSSRLKPMSKRQR